MCQASQPASCAVSRSEAGQRKALLILDKNFRPAGEIVLDIGARHFDLRDLQELSNLALKQGDRSASSTTKSLPRAAVPSEADKNGNSIGHEHNRMLATHKFGFIICLLG